MSFPLEEKMDKLSRKLKARTRPDGSARPGFEQNVAHLRAEMEVISGRIELAQEQGNTNDAE